MNKLLDKLPKMKRKISLYRQTISTFFKELSDISTLWTTRDFLMSSTELTYSLDNALINFKDVSYIPTEIVDILQSQGIYHKKYTLFVNNNKYNIQFYYPCHQDEKSLKQINTFFNKCLKQIFFWLHFVQSHIKKNCSNLLDISVFFSNHKKKLGHASEILTPLHVNSAFTTSCKINTSICIYRIEEWFKVFIHETFHCLGLDFSGVDNTAIEHLVTQHFKVTNENGIRVYETYCEIWAEILNVVILSFLKKGSKEDFIDYVDKQINYELSFSLFQTAKILDYNNIKYNDLIDVNCKTIMFREKTHVLSYYILKTILLFHLRDFENWCQHNNHTLLLFNTKKSNLNDFVSLIIKLGNQKTFITIINEFEVFFSKSKLNDSNKETMRMTISEG